MHLDPFEKLLKKEIVVLDAFQDFPNARLGLQ